MKTLNCTVLRFSTALFLSLLIGLSSVSCRKHDKDQENTVSLPNVSITAPSKFKDNSVTIGVNLNRVATEDVDAIIKVTVPDGLVLDCGNEIRTTIKKNTRWNHIDIVADPSNMAYGEYSVVFDLAFAEGANILESNCRTTVKISVDPDITGGNWSVISLFAASADGDWMEDMGDGWYRLINVAVPGETEAQRTIRFRRNGAVELGHANGEPTTVLDGPEFPLKVGGGDIILPESGSYDIYLNPEERKARVARYPDNSFETLFLNDKRMSCSYWFPESFSSKNGYTLMFHCRFDPTEGAHPFIELIGKPDDADPYHDTTYRFNLEEDVYDNNGVAEVGIYGKLSSETDGIGFDYKEHNVFASVRSNDAMGLEKWYSVALTISTNAVNLYVGDDVSSGFILREDEGLPSFDVSGISFPDGIDGAAIRLCYVSVWNSALSANEVKNNIFKTASGSSLVAFWPMTEGKGNDVLQEQTKAGAWNIDFGSNVCYYGTHDTANLSSCVGWIGGNVWD